MNLLPLVAGMAVGGITNAIGSGVSSGIQAQGARDARGIIDKYYTQAAGYQQPYYQQGTEFYKNLGGQLGRGEYDVDYSQQYQTPEFNYQADPGYAYRQKEGIGAIEGSAAAGGTGLSGAALRAMAKYGSGLASQEYGNAFNRYTNQRDFGYNQFQNRYQQEAAEKANRYNRYAAMAGTGQQAAGNLANLATGAGQAIADTTMQGANARAAGAQGIASGLGSIGQNIGQGAMLYGLMQPQAQTLGNVGQQQYPNEVPYYPYG